MFAIWQVNYYDVMLEVGENGDADTSVLRVAFNGTSKFTVTPNQGYYLDSLTCSNGYTASGYVTGLSATKAQSINIKNDNTASSGTCNMSFKVACPYSVGYSWEFNFTGNSQDFIVPCSGDYRIEAYGASGGSHTISMAGKGGYTAATVLLNKNQKLYAYVGEEGEYRAGINNSTYYSKSSWNGGGDGGSQMGIKGWHVGGAGGGASDIRIISGLWYDISSLRSRLLVAGGGGGAGCASAHNPGNGGGLIGATTLNPPGTAYPGASASGGTQISGGTAIGAWRGNGASTGSFGVGANAAQCGAGAGGGYYGGGSEYTAGGSGGSSYVKDCTGCDTTYIPYQGDFVFRDIDIQQGKHIGDGKIKITLHSIKT